MEVVESISVRWTPQEGEEDENEVKYNIDADSYVLMAPRFDFGIHWPKFQN